MSRLTKVTSKSQGPLLGLGTPGPALGALQSQARLRLGASFLEEQGMGDSEACPPPNCLQDSALTVGAPQRALCHPSVGITCAHAPGCPQFVPLCVPA